MNALNFSVRVCVCIRVCVHPVVCMRVYVGFFRALCSLKYVSVPERWRLSSDVRGGCYSGLRDFYGLLRVFLLYSVAFTPSAVDGASESSENRNIYRV